MDHHLISLLIFTPLVAAFASLFIPADKVNVFKVVCLSASVLQLITLIYMLINYKPGTLQFSETYNWITLELGSSVLKVEYFVGVDGLSVPLVALAVLILLIATIASWTIQKNVKGYFILLLILNAAII